MSSFLQITLKVDSANRAAAAALYTKYKQPFLDSVPGAKSKELLIRDEDVQVLHGITSASIEMVSDRHYTLIARKCATGAW